MERVEETATSIEITKKTVWKIVINLLLKGKQGNILALAKN